MFHRSEGCSRHRYPITTCCAFLPVSHHEIRRSRCSLSLPSLPAAQLVLDRTTADPPLSQSVRVSHPIAVAVGGEEKKSSDAISTRRFNPETQLIQSTVLILLDHPVRALSLSLSPFLVTTAKYLLCPSIHPASQPVTLRRRIIIVQSGLEEGGRKGGP